MCNTLTSNADVPHCTFYIYIGYTHEQKSKTAEVNIVNISVPSGIHS